MDNRRRHSNNDIQTSEAAIDLPSVTDAAPTKAPSDGSTIDARLAASAVDERSPVDWQKYATCYDLLCTLNPAYADLISRFSSFILASELSEDASILDLGGGTGNFFCYGLPEAYRSARLMHLDSNPGMLELAREKYRERQLAVEMIEQDASKYTYPAAKFDCVVSVNALYAMPNPRKIISRIYDALRPGGYLFLVNLGRIQNTLDWTIYLVARNSLKLGIRKTISILRNEGRIISEANRSIALAQRHRQYWQHTTLEIGEFLIGAGFQVQDLRPCYRGYSDLAICTKPKRHRGRHEARPISLLHT